MLKTGNIYSTDFCYGEVPVKYDPFDFETYGNNPMEFYVVATDIETGEAVYHRYEGTEPSGFDWIRASASMPLVSQIVEIDGRKMLDGGIADSIPVQYFEQLGYEKNVVVLTRPSGYQKEKNKVLPLIRKKYKAYPKLVEAMENRHERYNETLGYIRQQEQAGKIFVIRPEESIPVRRVEKDPERLKAAYEMGRKTMERQMDEVMEFLGR